MCAVASSVGTVVGLSVQAAVTVTGDPRLGLADWTATQNGYCQSSAPFFSFARG